MALPTNSNYTKEGCSPTSSNCVVWQGPDIPCINLCKGDSITEVTFKLAEELCTLLELVDVSTYELGCLNLVSDPENIKELIELLTERICALENADPGTPGGGSGDLPIVSLPACLHYTVGANTITELPLDEYAEWVATNVCNLVTDITAINDTLDNHETRITALESAPGGGGGGNTILSGGSDPINNVTGEDGDFYINTASWQIFGPRSAGNWGSGTDIQGADGVDGNGIVSVTQTGGTGAPGTTDEYTITFDDTSTFVFNVYNGADGSQVYFDDTGLEAGTLPTTGIQTNDIYIVKDEPDLEMRYYKYDGAAWVLELTIPFPDNSPISSGPGPNSYLFKAEKVIVQNLKATGSSNQIYVNFEDDGSSPGLFDNNDVWTQFSWEPDQDLTVGPNFIVESLSISNSNASDREVVLQFVKYDQSTGLTTPIGTPILVTAAGATTTVMARYESGATGIINVADNFDIRLTAYVSTSGVGAGEIKFNSGIIYNQN